jgi:hypothetical protein
MRLLPTFLALGAVPFALLAARPLLPADPDEAAVREALQHYLNGHATSSAEEFRQAFHPRANLYFIRDGQFTERTSADYIAGAKGGGPAPDEARRKRRIEQVDVTGTAAIATIVLEYPGVTFTDYMSLLKVDGRWQIVAKVFHAER